MTATPYQDAMKPLDPDAFNALVESIEKHGLLVPIVEDEQGRIVDGHQRDRALAALGVSERDRAMTNRVTLDLTGKTDEERTAIAIEINAMRRHLSVPERKAAVKRLKELGLSTRQIAASTGTSQSTVVTDLKEAEAAGTGEQDNSPVPSPDNKVVDEVKDEDILATLASGKTIRQTAEVHGISHTTVQRAKDRAKRAADKAAGKAPAKRPAKKKPLITITAPTPEEEAAERAENIARLMHQWMLGLIDRVNETPDPNDPTWVVPLADILATGIIPDEVVRDMVAAMATLAKQMGL